LAIVRSPFDRQSRASNQNNFPLPGDARAMAREFKWPDRHGAMSAYSLTLQ